MTLRRKLGWMAVLYFAEGLPFGVVKEVLPVYFKVQRRRRSPRSVSIRCSVCRGR